MASVCRNPDIQNFYLDQIDERNRVEKAQFRDIFTDYMDLMDDFANLQERAKGLENENYILKQSGVAVGGTSLLSEKERGKYEEKIKVLEQQLLKAQDGKISNTDMLLELTQVNKKLTSDKQELEQ